MNRTEQRGFDLSLRLPRPWETKIEFLKRVADHGGAYRRA